MNCCICSREIDPNGVPTPKTVERFKKQSGKEISGIPCSRCIYLFAGKRTHSNLRGEKPIAKVISAIETAIKRGDYPAFADAQSEIEQHFDEAEREVTKAYQKLDQKVKLRNLISTERSRLFTELNKSPSASYFLRRAEADRVISRNEVRIKVFQKDGFKCVSCGEKNRLTVDHIIPVVAGGGDDFSNLQTLCVWCNSSKGGRKP